MSNFSTIPIPAVAPRTETVFPPVSVASLRTRPVQRFNEVLRSTNTPASEATPPAAYTVKKGDVLSGIVLRHLRETGQTPSNSALYDMVSRVARANGLTDPDLIMPGQELDLSVLDPQGPAPTAHAALAEMAPQAGASLSRPVLVAKRTDPLSPPRAVVSRGGHPEPSSIRQDAIERTLANVRAVLRQLAPEPEESLPATGETASGWERILPGSAHLTSGFGRRRDPITGQPEFHSGIDLGAPRGADVKPMLPGVVVFSGWKGGYGKTVIVKHSNGLETLYGHNSQTLVHAGDRVDGSKTIALVGSTGRSTGPHVHFEIRKDGRAVNPIPYLQQDTVQLASAR